MEGLKIHILKNLKEKYNGDKIKYYEVRQHIMKVFRVPKCFIDNLISELIYGGNVIKSHSILILNYSSKELDAMIVKSNIKRNKVLTE